MMRGTRDHGLKGLGIDVNQAWSRVFRSSLVVGVKAVYKEVAEATEELVSALGNTEIKAIRATLTNHHRVNQSFDLLGLMYPN